MIYKREKPAFYLWLSAFSLYPIMISALPVSVGSSSLTHTHLQQRSPHPALRGGLKGMREIKKADRINTSPGSAPNTPNVAPLAPFIVPPLTPGDSDAGSDTSEPGDENEWQKEVEEGIINPGDGVNTDLENDEDNENDEDSKILNISGDDKDLPPARDESDLNTSKNKLDLDGENTGGWTEDMRKAISAKALSIDTSIPFWLALEKSAQMDSDADFSKALFGWIIDRKIQGTIFMDWTLKTSAEMDKDCDEIEEKIKIYEDDVKKGNGLLELVWEGPEGKDGKPTVEYVPNTPFETGVNRHPKSPDAVLERLKKNGEGFEHLNVDFLLYHFVGNALEVYEKMRPSNAQEFVRYMLAEAVIHDIRDSKVVNQRIQQILDEFIRTTRPSGYPRKNKKPRKPNDDCNNK